MAFKLEQNEHIVTIARRHWFKLVMQTMLIFFSLLIPLVVSSIVVALPQQSAEFGNLTILSMVFILMWIFIIWNLGFIIWTNHFLDVLVITNKQIIDIEQIGLWNREISTLQINKIQDISTKTEGFIPSLLDYGDLEIQSAGSLTNFIVKEVQKPDLLRQKINEQIMLN